MEQFPQLTETQESREKTKERWVRKARKIFGIWAISGLAALFAAQEAHAQNNDKGQSNKIETVWQPTAVTPSPELKQSIENQKQWLLDYLHSNKYEERLSKEVIRSKQLYKENDSLFSAQFTKPLVDESDDTIAIMNSFEGWTVWKNNEKADHVDFDKLMTIENIFPDIDTSLLSPSQHHLIEMLIRIRTQNIENGNYVVVDSIASDPGTRTLGEYTPLTSVQIIENLPDDQTETPIHEFTHQSTSGNEFLDEVTKKILKRYVGTNSEYLSSPTEILARVNVLRYLLSINGEYDTKTRDFTETDYERMKNNEDIMKNGNVQEIMRLFEKDELIWIMNNIADANNGTHEVLFLA